MNGHVIPRVGAPTPRSGRPGQDGQVIVLLALALMRLVAGAGLVLDGGRAFAQRRDEQNVSDHAAMAGAYAYLNATGDHAARAAAAEAAARALAAASGYPDGVGGTSIGVAVSPLAGGATVQVGVTRPQANTFARILGQPSWQVSTEATALATNAPNTVSGAMPLLFNIALFQRDDADGDGTDDDGLLPETEVTFDEPGTGTEDVPQEADEFNWTVYCTAHGNPCNADSNTVRDIIEGFGEGRSFTTSVDIGPLNAGAHTTLFDALAAHVGKSMPVAVVNDEGEIQGWGWFRLTGSTGGSTKQIRGFFNPGDMEALPFTLSAGASAGDPILGVNVVRLID